MNPYEQSFTINTHHQPFCRSSIVAIISHHEPIVNSILEYPESLAAEAVIIANSTVQTTTDQASPSCLQFFPHFLTTITNRY